MLAEARVALVNSEGRLLLFPIAEVPEMPRGKGNKLFAIPAKKSQSARGGAGCYDGAGAGAVAGGVLGRAAR